MRFGKPSNHKPRQRITLNLASMIDVTFLLLVYFLLTTVLVPAEDRLSPTLQVQRESDAGQVSDFQPQVVAVRQINGVPGYQLGERILSNREELAAALSQLSTEAGLFINVHDNVPVGFAAAAMQVAHDAGFEQVTYVPVQ